MSTEVQSITINTKKINEILPATNHVNEEMFQALNSLCKNIHQVNVEMGWWASVKSVQQNLIIIKSNLSPEEKKELIDALGISNISDRNMGELLCLVHSEISEAMEGFRKNLMDDKLKDRKMFDVELGDAVIRIFDICGKYNIPLGTIIAEKVAFNTVREDHKMENRMKENGKKF